MKQRPKAVIMNTYHEEVTQSPMENYEVPQFNIYCSWHIAYPNDG